MTAHSSFECLDVACAECHGLATTTVIDVGTGALLVYPAGDCDRVTVVALADDDVTVRLPDGRLYRTVPEDIGLGVDDDLSSAVHLRGIRCARAETTRDCRHGHRWDGTTVAVGL